MINVEEVLKILKNEKGPKKDDDFLIFCTKPNDKCRLNYENFCLADKCNSQALIRLP